MFSGSETVQRLCQGMKRNVDHQPRGEERHGRVTMGRDERYGDEVSAGRITWTGFLRQSRPFFDFPQILIAFAPRDFRDQDPIAHHR